MSRTEKVYFPSKADGLTISVLKIYPEKVPFQGVFQLNHGMCEHKERYIPFMNFLAEQGYVSVIHDYRGHGESVRDPQDLGYMYDVGADGFLEDILSVNESVHQEFPDLPVIMFGHSMGSLAVRAFASAHDTRIDMLVICGEVSDNAGKGAGMLLAKAEKRIFGARHKSRLLTDMSLGAYAKAFPSDDTDNAWLCTDPAVVKEYDASPLCGFMFTDDAFLTLFSLMKKSYDLKHWTCSNPEMPVLFVSGAEDPCMGNVRQFAKAVRAMRSAGYKSVRGRLYPGMRHEILNETGKEKVWQDIVKYVRKKIG